MNNNIKKNLPALIITVLVIALAAAFVKIDALESEINNVRNHYASEVSILRGEINAIYDNVDAQMKAQASLLSNVEYELCDLNVQDHTVNVALSVTPKTITDDMQISVSCAGRTSEFTRNGSAFTASIPVDLFNEEEKLLLTITTADAQQTEYLRDVYVDYLWTGYLPSLYYCDISGSGTFTEGKYTLDASIDINCSPFEDTPDVRFEKFVLVTELNGKEISREDITEDVLNYQTYPHGVYFRDEYHMECEASEGDELIIRLEATDSMGYVHKMVLHYWKEHNGATAETINGSELIYDADGKLIYGKE